MDTPTRDEFTIRYTDNTGTIHRTRFQPRDDTGWWRIEEVWNGCQWRLVGQEHVSDLSVDR